MDEFTNEEKHRIDLLYGEDFKSEDFTPDDVKLIQRWEKWKAEQDAELQARIEAMKAESASNIERADAAAKAMQKNLKEFASKARKRYKELRQNG